MPIIYTHTPLQLFISRKPAQATCKYQTHYYTQYRSAH